MSYEKIIDTTKKIESILVKEGAEGRGLHEKVSSIEAKLNNDLIKKLRFIATIRNKLLHDVNVKLTEDILEKFNDASKEAVSELTNLFKEEESIPESEGVLDSLPTWVKVVGVAVIGAFALFSE